MEIARGLARYLTFNEIAAELGCSPRTVKFHSDTIRTKLGLSRARDIPKVMKQLGLLS